MKIGQNVKSLITVGLLTLFVISCSAPASPPTSAPAPTQAAAPTVAAQATSAPQPTATTQPRGGDLVWGFSVELSGADPHVNTANSLTSVATGIYDFLTVVTPDFKVNPSLASAWQISADGKTYTIMLRKGVKFHDGTELDAAAVKANFDRILDPKTASQTKSRLGPLDSVRVVDPSTIEFKLTDPYGLFLNALGDIPAAIASPTALAKWGADYQFHQVGSGPFKFVEYVAKSSIKLAPNPDYNWASVAYGRNGPPLLDSLTFRMLPDPATRLAALQAGEIQGAEEISEAAVAGLKNNPKFQVVVTNPPGMSQQWSINTTLAPTDDLAVRQAIQHAVNKQAIIDIVFQGISKPAYGPLMDVVYGHSDTVKNMYPFNPQKAKDLLDQAGWKDTDNDGIRDRNRVPLTVKMATWAFNSSPQVAQVIQSQLKDVGIKMDIEQLAFAAILQKGKDATANLVAAGGTRDDGSILLDYFLSKNNDTSFNAAKYKSPELDKVLTDAFTATDRAAAGKLYQRAEEVIMQNALLLPTQDYAVITGLSSNVKGVIFRPNGRQNAFYNAYIQK